MEDLQIIIKKEGIEENSGNYIKEQFLPFFNQAKEWETKAKELVVTDVSQVEEIKQAREARLALKTIRVNANKTRKELKEESLRYGKAVQGVYNVIEFLISPIEKHLEKQEKFAELKEAERIAELKLKRENEITPYSEFVPFGIDLSLLSEEDYKKLLNGCKLQFNNKIEEEKRLEQERIAREKAEKERQEKIKKENERLRKEAIEREKKAKKEEEKRAKADAIRKAKEEKERKKLEAKLKAEREEKERIEREEKAKRDKLEAELQARKDAERKAKEEEEKRIQRELQKGDSAKVKDLLNDLETLKTKYSFKSKKNKAKYNGAKTLIDKVIIYINQ